MPAAIPYIAQAIGTAFASVAGYAAAAAALTLVQRSLTKKPGQGATPLNITVRSTVAPRRLLFGTVRAAGSMLFVRTSGSNSKYLWYVVAYAGHQCSALKDLYLDKYKIPAADINGTTGAVATAVMDGKLKCWDHLGTSAQAVDTNLDSEFSTEWTSNHRLRGICYRVIRFERSDKAFPTGAPESCTSIVDGAKLYDPRLDSTNGGAGSHRRDDPSTWAFSNNPALVLRWFLTGGSVINDLTARLVRYGLKEDDSRIPDAYTIAAANLCDQSVSGGNAPPTGAQVRYTCDLEVSCDQPRREILEEILATMGPGQLVSIHGKWRMYGAQYDAPSHAFDENDLHGPIEIDDTTEGDERVNQLSGLYVDAAKDYTDQSTPVRSDASYVTQDAGVERFDEISIRGCTDQYRAQRLVELALRRKRQMRRMRIPFGRQGLKIAPWETFTLDHTRYGWSGRVLRCLVGREIEYNDKGGMTVWVTAMAETSAVYTDLVTADYSTGTSVTNALQSEAPDAPTSLAAKSLPGAIQFDWSVGEFWRQFGVSEIWEAASGAAFGTATKIWEGRSTRAVIPKADTTFRAYWVRVATVAGQVSSTEPASTGLEAVALPGWSVVSDPQFAIANSTHWDLSGAATLSTTGGNVGGYVELDGASVSGPSASIRSIPSHPQNAVRGEIFSISCRLRRKPASATPEGYIWARVQRMDAPTNAASSTVGGSHGGILVAGSAIPTDWTEYTGLIFIAGDYADADVPYLCAHASYECYSPGGFTDGEIQIDQLNLVRGQGANPFIFTFTSSTTLQNFDPAGFGTALGPSPLGFALCRYNSASPGTLTLPTFVTTRDVGLKIYFEQVGAGALTIAGGTMGMRTSPGSSSNRTMAGQYARAVFTADADGTWHGEGQFT